MRPRVAHRCHSAEAVECPRAGQPNTPPEVSLKASEEEITLPCRSAETPAEGAPGGGQVRLRASATDADGDRLLYTYSTTGGRLVGDGPEATWDLSGVRPGEYTVTVEAHDGCGCIAFASARVRVAACAGELIGWGGPPSKQQRHAPDAPPRGL